MTERERHEREWHACGAPARLIHRLGKVGPRRVRLFVCGCCRRIWDVIPDERSRHAVDVAERFADGEATAEELAAAQLAAGHAVPRGPTYNQDTDAKAYSGTWVCYHAAGPDPAAALWVWSDPAETAGGAGARWADRPDAVCHLIRDVVGNPFRPVTLDPAWLTPTVVQLARGIYDERAFDRMSILADALQDAGCENDDVLTHCRGPGPHVRGCWVLDLVLGKS